MHIVTYAQTYIPLCFTQHLTHICVYTGVSYHSPYHDPDPDPDPDHDHDLDLDHFCFLPVIIFVLLVLAH
jgi:hypothetical protein